MDINDAFQTPLGGAPWEKKDNPCSFTASQYAYVSPVPQRNQLGLVGGNEVSMIRGSAIDLESDLRGITRINTHAPWNDYQPTPAGNAIKRENWKTNITIDTTPMHLKESQFQAMPAVYAPKPIIKDNCMQPHKF